VDASELLIVFAVRGKRTGFIGIWQGIGMQMQIMSNQDS
jgi:hypothetical protein